MFISIGWRAVLGFVFCHSFVIQCLAGLLSLLVAVPGYPFIYYLFHTPVLYQTVLYFEGLISFVVFMYRQSLPTLDTTIKFVIMTI